MAKRLTAIKAIRAFCVECTCGDPEWIRECPSNSCPLWVYRMGRNPNISQQTREKQRQRALRRGFRGKSDSGVIESVPEEKVEN